ncbi:unnamed protein product [Leptosia nina]|uniref:RRM domain-containing protein n=1 Tax=Leptosia nina TaxID=320188 RepID=A0AAV1JEJ6_9NEOP
MSYGRPPPRIDGMVSLKVDNLTYRTTPEDLRRVFERCGDVGDIYIPRDRYTRESRGFAFVRFYDRRDAEEALDSLDGRAVTIVAAANPVHVVAPGLDPVLAVVPTRAAVPAPGVQDRGLAQTRRALGDAPVAVLGLAPVPGIEVYG